MKVAAIPLRLRVCLFLEDLHTHTAFKQLSKIKEANVGIIFISHFKEGQGGIRTFLPDLPTATEEESSST